MQKTIYSEEQRILLRLLREARRSAGLTQVQLAERLGEDQSWVSRVESGERRLDVLEFRTYCGALTVPVLEFMERLERELGRETAPS
jgi:transcriptional regulator with XRE-family HTH domain